MIVGGYFAKRVEPAPESFPANVTEICSVSNCISKPSDRWIERWLHNECGWFNSVADATSVLSSEELREYRLFAYQIHPRFFQSGHEADVVMPPDVKPDPIPSAFRSLGFDCVSKSMPSILGFECSPLSCNSLASEFDVNAHCLLPSLDAAISAAKRFAIEQPEPGDYYVVEVLERS